MDDAQRPDEKPGWLGWEYRVTFLPLVLVSFFGWASAPEPVAVFCAPLAFFTVAGVYGLLARKWPEAWYFTSIVFLLGCAALIATIVGTAAGSYGWGFLTFAVGIVVAGFANRRFWRWRGDRRGARRRRTAR